MKKKDSIFFTANNVELKQFKGVKQFKGRLDGESCLVIGSEAAGKSNLVQAIYMVLKQYPSAIVSQGAEDSSAKVEISKGNTKYLFKFHFEEGEKPKMKTLVDGERVTIARQTEIIKKLTPKTFDLDELIQSTGQKQSDIILKAFDIDVSQEKETYQEAFNERKIAKRSLEEASHFEVKEKAEKVDTAALRKELEEANANNQLREKAFLRLENYKTNKKETEKEVERLKAELKTQEDKLKDIKESIKAGEEYLKDQPKEIDTQKITDKLSEADLHNEKAREYKEFLKNKEVKKKKEKEVKSREAEVKESAKKITNKINSAKIPIEGLEIKTTISESSGRASSELTYKGLPFDEESINTAERLAIGVRLQMSLLEENNLGIITVNAGSIGDATIQSIAKECKSQGLQCLFELTSRQDDKQLELETVLKG